MSYVPLLAGLQPVHLLGLFIFLVLMVVQVVVVAPLFNLWIQAYMSQAAVSMADLIGMRFRKVDAKIIVLNRIKAVKAGINLPTHALEVHFLAGGRVSDAVNALIAADRAGVPLDWETVCANDLAGRDLDTPRREDRLQSLVGRTGRAVGPFRSVGTCEFDGRRCECVSERGMIEDGNKVEAVSLEGQTVLVRPLSQG